MNFSAPRPNLQRLGLTAACLLALFTPASSFAESKAPEKGVSIEGITEYRLDTGLRFLLFPDPSSSTVTVNLTVLVGSRHEGYGETGMAHLLEHMVFKGTPTHKDVPKALKEHGANFNGTTWVDRTNYFETMPATDENLEFGIKLEADRMVNSFVRREDLISEMTVVRNEFEAGENNPGNILSQRMMKAAYEWHNYGKSTIGNRSDIERVPIDRLHGFYKKYYRPDNAMLVVAGKFDEKKAIALITKYFGAQKTPAAQLDPTYTEEPAQDGERNVTLRRVGKIGVVGVIYHVPSASHEDFPAVQILNSILVSEPSGRLYEALVPTKKATTVSGSAFAWHDPGVLEVSAEVDPKNSLDVVRDTMLDVLEKLAKEKITDEEVARAKNKFKRDRELAMTNSGRIGIQLSEWAAAGDWRLFFLHRDRTEKVTAADVSRVAAKYLTRNNRTVGVFIPTEAVEAVRATIPANPDVTDLVKDYKGQKAVVTGEAFDPTPENIEKRTKRTVPSSGGPKAALLPKKSRGESVTLQLSLRFGNEKSLAGSTTAAEMLGTLMLRGTDKHTRQQLQDELDKLGARLSAASAPGVVQFSIETKRENFAKVVDLLIEVMKQPTFPVTEFDILRREKRDYLSKGLTEPNLLAPRALQRQLNPYDKADVRYIPTIEEEIARLDAVTVDQVKQLYQKQLGGQNSTLAVVGDFDDLPATQAPLPTLRKLLADWKSDTPYERIARPAKTTVEGKKDSILTPDKENAIYIAGHYIAMTDADPDYPALEIANFVLGGGTLSSRLGNRVRQKDGLSYGVGSRFSADAKDKAGRFMLFAICNPKNIDKVDKAIAEEIEKMLKDGITSDELAEAKKSYLEREKVSRATDQALAGLLATSLYEDRTMAYYSDLEKKIEALTVDGVNTALRKNFDLKKLVIVRAGDFNKK